MEHISEPGWVNKNEPNAFGIIANVTEVNLIFFCIEFIDLFDERK